MMRVGNAPCSWGVLELEGAEGASDSRVVLEEMSSAGYAGTELGDWGFLPTDPGPLRALLDEHRLELISGFVPVPLSEPSALADGRHAALRVARLMAAVAKSPFVVLSDDNGRVPERAMHAGRVTPTLELSEEGRATLAHAAEEIARAVRDETGLRTVFHHHCAGYVETPGELRDLCERTDAELLGVCFDTGHCAFGGGDPVPALRSLGERVWHIHFKDCDAAVADRSRVEEWGYLQSVREGVFCELGRGVIDFVGVLEELRRRDYDGWIVVEQDVLPGTGTPLESARRNREFLEGVGL